MYIIEEILSWFRRTPRVPFSERPYAIEVERGAAFLDNTYGPEWIDKINTRKLIIYDPDRCVLAQVYGSFANGLRTLPYSTIYDSYDYGFMSIRHADWSPLRDRWVELVKDRRAAQNA